VPHSTRLAMLILTLALSLPALHAAPLTPVPLANGDFSEGAQANGLPVGWQQYAGSEQAKVTVDADGKTVTIDDQDPAAEIGITQTFEVKPE
jgi:hypothetical protein